MDSDHVNKGDDVKPQFGEHGFFCVELFCGTGNLTYAMKHFFPDSFGIDHKVTKQKVKIVCLDLTKDDHQALVESWLLSGRCLWVHFGVPCGTASRARFRRLSRKIHGPPPLRNSKFPDGIPGIKGPHLIKLRAANKLYSFMRRLILQLNAANVVWTVENPYTSLLWETSYWREVDEAVSPFYCELHNCMFGGQRLKRTCLASNCGAIMALNILCDGRHEHAPWAMTNGVFDTSLEAEYTPMLARALASTILESLAKEYKLPNVVQFSKSLKLSHFQALAAAKQPSKSMSMHIVPEYSHILVLSNVPAATFFSLKDGSLAQCVTLQVGTHTFFVPCSSKLLRKTEKKGGESRLFKFSLEQTPSLCNLGDAKACGGLDRGATALRPLECTKAERKCSCVLMSLDPEAASGECVDWVFGVRWTPEQFLEQAINAGHPFANFSGLPTEVRLACEELASCEHAVVVNNRCSKLGEWLRLAKSLKQDEDKLRDAMPCERRKILANKRLLLMQHIIECEGYEDSSLAKDVRDGFSLVGEVPMSHVLPKKLLPASISEKDLQGNSHRANVALRYMTRSSGDRSLDDRLWEKTELEVDKGWLLGPLSWDDLQQGDTVSRRFPIEQGGKVRPIDDLSQSQVNSTVTCYEQATVDGPDVICAFATYLMRCLQLQGRETELLGRSLDLASAYRQLAIADSSRRHAFLTVYNPHEGKACLFQQVALPFGSRTAVNAFIRCARFIQWVAAKCLRLPLSCYFDDFVAFTMPSLANNSQAALTLMLDLLGWDFDRTGPKSDDFSALVGALGVQFDLSGCKDGLLRVRNTEKRVHETVCLLDNFLASGLMHKRDALVLRGRLAFCDAFVFGRLGKVALQEITKHAYASPFREQLQPTLISALKLLRGRVLDGKPRLLTCKMLDTLYLLTDASYEQRGDAGLGAVLVADTGSVLGWFGMLVEKEQLSTLIEDGQENIIGELETLAVAMSLLLWSGLLESTQLMVYIDNEGAKFSLIKGYSTSKKITSICALAATCLDSHFVLPWFARIPSPSNLADFPSRQLSHPLLKENAQIPKEEVERAFTDSMVFVSKACSPQ